MRKIKKLLSILIIAVVFGAVIFQLFFRYEFVEIGAIDLKYDRLTSSIYFRPMFIDETKKSEWHALPNIKNFRLAKAWAFRRQMRTNDIGDIENRLDDLESRIER